MSTKVEEKYGLKTGHAIALFVILILNVCWLITTTVVNKDHWLSLVLVPFLMFVVAVYYTCSGYKKPHGNHLRYLLLCSSVFSAIQYLMTGIDYPTYITAVTFAIIILKTYMAGRLGHFKQNVIIYAVILIFQCIIYYFYIDMFVSSGHQLTFVYLMAPIGPVSLWLAIAGAYITRYRLHKEAGFADKN